MISNFPSLAFSDLPSSVAASPALDSPTKELDAILQGFLDLEEVVSEVFVKCISQNSSNIFIVVY